MKGNNQNTDTAGFAEHIIELNSQQSLSFKCENKNDNNAKILSVLEEIKILLKTNKEVDSSLKNIEKELSSSLCNILKKLDNLLEFKDSLIRHYNLIDKNIALGSAKNN